MLLDHFLPRYDISKRHTTIVRATPERVYDAIRTADLAEHPVVRLLLALRGMKRGIDRGKAPRDGFHILADEPPRELVIGLEGPFWKPNCRLHPIDAESFVTTPVPNDCARGAWNFLVERRGDLTHLSTETRVLCSDDARRKFRLYWLVIGNFSGLIRRLMLRTIRRAAEA